MRERSILIDFEKMKDPFSGLGQFCLHLKKHFDVSGVKLKYWRPGEIGKIARKVSFFLPYSNVFHAVHQDSPYVPWSKKTKYVLTIHDLNALYEKTQFGTGEGYKRKLQKKIDRANVVTFISHFAKEETKRHLKIDESKTQVIYNGIALGTSISRPQIIPKHDYLFSIGTVLPKKNFEVLIDFLKEIPEYAIVLAGTTYHQYAKNMLARIESEGLSDRFFLVGTINEEEKLWYYQNAKAFIFPSLLEGFGLPVAEAMNQGLPLFLSDKTSLPEIGGEDAYYFKDFSPESMRDTFLAGMKDFDEAKRQRLIERSKLFDWKKAADQYLAIYLKS